MIQSRNQPQFGQYNEVDMNVSSCHQKQCATSPQLGGHVTEPDPETHSLSRFWLRDVSAQVSCWQKHRNRARNQGNPAVTFQSMSPQSQNQRHTACSIPTELKCHKLCVPRSGSEVSQKSEANPQVYPKPMTPSLSH